MAAHSKAHCRLLVLWAALLMLHVAVADVVSLYSVERHGARNVLPKTSLLVETDADGGPSLLPQGQRQKFDAGSAFRQRYIDRSTCNSTCLTGDNNQTEYGSVNTSGWVPWTNFPGIGFNHHNTMINSSALVRTLMSSQSYFSGIFPASNVSNSTWYIPTGQKVVPVFTVPDENDTMVRAYTKCPAYDAALQDWYASPTFLQKSNGTAAFREKIKSIGNFTDDYIQLTNWWNVYDSFNTWQTYHVGDEQPALNTTDFQEMTDLAYWLEVSKMNSNLTHNLLGGRLVDNILYFMNATRDALNAVNPPPFYYKLMSVSAHYNTQLGLLAALALDKSPNSVAAFERYFNESKALNWLATGSLTSANPGIPRLASVMVFELHSVPQPNAAGNAYVVRLVYQDGPNVTSPGPGTPYRTIPLPCAQAGDIAESSVEAGACTLDNFIKMAQPAAVSEWQWCDLCANVQAATCYINKQDRDLAAANVKIAALQQQPPPAGNGGGNGPEHANWKVAVSVVVTFVGTLLICAVVFVLLLRSYRSKAGHSYIKEATPVASLDAAKL